jgi:hypothetical protein
MPIRFPSATRKNSFVDHSRHLASLKVAVYRHDSYHY